MTPPLQANIGQRYRLHIWSRVFAQNMFLLGIMCSLMILALVRTAQQDRSGIPDKVSTDTKDQGKTSPQHTEYIEN